MKIFRIGNFLIELNEDKLKIEQDFFLESFAFHENEQRNGLEKIRFVAVESDFSMLQEAKLIKKTGLNEWYDTNKGKFLLYHWARCRFAYGYYVNELQENQNIKLYYNPLLEKEIEISAIKFFSTLGIHVPFLKRGALILHASHVEWKGSSILFMGPSQTGKSTQAYLWEHYKNADIINEDRVLINKINNNWHSFGYPCCGSSKVCKNKTLPMRMIVLLEQGKNNQIVPLTLAEKIRALLVGSELYNWNPWEFEQIITVATELINQIPMIKLICTPDQEAVATLKNYMEEL